MILASAVGICIAVAIAVVLWPVSFVALVGATVITIALAWTRTASTRVYLFILAFCLAGYAFLGRGFAYIGLPPVYIGEALLLTSVVYLLTSAPLLNRLLTPVTYTVAAFMLIGAASSFPYVSVYGIDTLRDAALWGYGTFALVVPTALSRNRGLFGFLSSYGRILPYFLVWVPIALILYRLYPGFIPAHPSSGVPLLHPKSGDIAVHLVGAMGFLVLGLGRRSQRQATPGEWIIWIVWLVGCVGVLVSRGAILTLAAGVSVLLAFRPNGRWGKVLAVSALAVYTLVALDVEVTWGSARKISAEDLALSIRSIFTETNEGPYDGSRAWRLQWWTEIVNYTLFGELFWTGKGYGINLADADGFQVLGESALRSPHNVHLTILARSGVPGLVSWLILQATFAIGLIRAHLQAKRSGEDMWSRFFVWVLAYWTASLVNGTFDVYLEGPQGGIWFWTIVGLGAAGIDAQRGRVGQLQKQLLESRTRK